MPNFRLYDTQARWGVYTSVLGAAALAGMTYIVFKGFSAETRTIPFDANSGGLGHLRPQLVLLLTPIVAILGVVSFGFGYSSLGEKKNTRQSSSLAGMAMGTALFTFAVLLFLAWKYLSVQVIR